MRAALKAQAICAELALTILVAAPSTISLPSLAFAAAPKASSTFSDFTAEAKEHRAAGRHVEAAEAFSAAYEALGADEQRGLKGEITIGNAIDDYRIAQEDSPKSVGLLFQEASLLERYGKHIGGLPEELRMELQRVKVRVEAVHREEEERKAEERLTEEVQRRLEAERESEAKAGPVGEVTKPESSRRAANVAILGTGVASVVGGIALLAGGVRNIGQVEQRSDALLEELDANGGGTPQMRDDLRHEIEEWRDRWRGIGTGLAVTGGTLAAVGIGLATWGAIRMHKDQQRSGRMSVIGPMISGRSVGLAVVGRF